MLECPGRAEFGARVRPSPSEDSPSVPSPQPHTPEAHMGRLAVNVAGLPKIRRGAPFKDEENTRLVEEVEQRLENLYGTKDRPAQPHKVRLAWKEIAEIISSVSSVPRSGDQCRKRYNDIRRKRNMMAEGRKRGRPSKHSTKGDFCRILEANKLVEPEDLEFEVQAPMDDDPDYEPMPKKRDVAKVVVHEPALKKRDVPKIVIHELSPTKRDVPKVVIHELAPKKRDVPKVVIHELAPKKRDVPKVVIHELAPKKRELPKVVVPKEIPTPAKPDLPTASSPSLSKSRSVVVRKPAVSSVATKHQPDDETHPFLELQQAGFNMLQKELSGFRDSVMSLNTRLNHLEIALRPIGSIAESLARVANAVERLTCPPE